MAIRSVLCDIEGTTSSISFVHKVLFPLSLEKLDDYLETHVDDAELQQQLGNLRSRTEAADRRSVAEILKGYIRDDVKDTTLKWIQGKIWKQAFEAGDVRGHVYPEVPEFFRLWRQKGLQIHIYSSGSVEAQQQLFRYSEAGDLTGCLDGYFDTTTGMKREKSSYEKIAKATGNPPEQMLFLSDIVEELYAADAAGMKTCLLLREYSSAPAAYAGAKASDFAQVDALFFA